MPEIIVKSEDLKIPETAFVKDGENINYIETFNRLASSHDIITGIQIPDKFKVKKEGTEDTDISASILKISDSYGQLEKKLGSGDIAPKAETEYKLDYTKLPEGMKVDPEREKKFLKKFHGAGMSNRQVQAVMDEYADLLIEGSNAQKTQEEASVNALKKAWPGEEFDKNSETALKGFLAYADEEDKAALDEIKKHPALIKILFKIGRDLTEDTNINMSDVGGEDGVKKLMQDKEGPYWNDKHPDHKKTVEMVQKYYKSKYK